MSAARQLDIDYRYDLDEILKVNKKKAVRRMNSPVFAVVVTLVSFVLLFTVLFSLVNRYAMISETKYAIFTLKKEIKALNMKKEELHYKLDTSVALDNIERISMEQLGMTYPTQGQMIYIQASNDYNLAMTSVLESDESVVKEEDFIDELVAIAARFVR